MVKVCIIVTILVNSFVFAQQNDELLQGEKHLNQLLTELRAAKNDEAKERVNQTFKDSLLIVLNKPSAFDHPFTSLRTMGVIASPDASFKLYTWNVEWEDLTHSYECLIQRYNYRKKEYQIIELKDQSVYQDERPTDILNQDNWYGALYYQIIPFEKGNRDMYLVMGWDGFTAMSNRKVLDVLYFSGNQVKLGSPVFKNGNETQKRVFFEFAENANMSLRFDEKYNRILMDHLSPESSNLKGFYAYYVPDMSYDAYVMEKGKWYLKEDVIAVNEKTTEKIDIYVQGENGEVKQKKLKNKWQNPSQENSPGGGEIHVAQTPESTGELEGNRKDKKNTKATETKKGRNGKSNIFPIAEGKKRKRKD